MPSLRPLPRLRIADRSPRRRRGGFTLVELLVLAGMIAVLLAIFIPSVVWLRETRNRTACANNLRSINQALLQYANANGHTYPRVVYDAETRPNSWTAFTGPDDPDPFSEARGGVKPNDVTACLWLLVRTEGVATASFVCPSTDDRRDLMLDDRGNRVEPLKRGNFRSPANLSYSYAQPFSAAINYRNSSDSRPAEFVMLADRNPGKSVAGTGQWDVTAVRASDPPLRLARGNSRNHGGAGQNVLFASGAVEFVTTPFCGAGRNVMEGKTGDNIYTALRRMPLEGERPPANDPGEIGDDIGPAWAEDTYLVPFER